MVIDAAFAAHGEGMQAYLIMMSSRLVEFRRMLKPSGTKYLHCDPVASHYLKAVMDAIFGATNFRNEIGWKRRKSHSNSRTFGRVAGDILFYGSQINRDSIRVKLSDAEARSRFRYKDKNGNLPPPT